MHPFERIDLDPSVTDEEIERAFDGEPAPFVDADEQDSPEDAARSLVVVPASKPQRIDNARKLRDNHTFVGVGQCLATVRGPILGVPAFYPTAADAADNSKPFHPIDNAGSIQVPRAAIGFAWNGGAGHTWLELGAVRVAGRPQALVSSTDFHENGFEGVCLRSRMLTWCGADRWGWGESVNGFDVWPDPRKPKPPAPKPLTLDEKINLLVIREKALRRAGKDRQADRVHLWTAKLKARQ